MSQAKGQPTVLVVGDFHRGFRILGPFVDLDRADLYSRERGQREESPDLIVNLFEPSDYTAGDWLSLVGQFLEFAASALRREDTTGLESIMGEVAEKTDLLAEAVERMLDAQAEREC